MSNTTLVKPPATLAFAEPRPRAEFAPRPNAPLSPHQPLTVVNLLRGLRRMWRMAVGIGLLMGIAGAALVWLFLPPAKPSVYAKIYFLPVMDKTRYERSDPPLKEQTQKELIQSRMLLEKVVTRPEIAELESIKGKPDAVAWLIRELTVEFPPSSEIMKIAIQGDRPDDLKEIIRAIKDTYLQENEQDRAEREERLRLGLAKAEREYNATKDETGQKNADVGSGDPATVAFKQREIEREINLAKAEMKTAAGNIEKNKRDQQALQRKIAEPIDVGDVAYETIFLMDDEIGALTKHRKDAEKRLADRRRLVARDHPSLDEIGAEIKNIQVKLDERKKELRPLLETKVNQKLAQDTAKLKDDLAFAEGQEEFVRHLLEKLEKDHKALNSATQRVEGTHKDLLKLKAKVDDFELALDRVKDAHEAPRAKTMEEATIVRPNEGARKSRFALGTFVAICLVTLLGFAFAEYRTRRIGSPDEVAYGLGMTVMGTVPARPDRAAKPMLAGPANAEQLFWEHLIEESVDSARTLFLHTAEANALRVVVITSAVGGEGKTSLSCQLAKSLARSGRRVLLIDGDLRSPSIHQHFGVNLQPGVCEHLRSELRSAALVRETPVENLSVMTAGQCDPRAVQQLAMDGFRRLLEEVRKQFDFVLIDTCPVLPVADALLMARHADGVLLSMMCDRSQVDRVQAASQKLASIGAHVIGAVVQGAGAETYGYGPRYVTPLQV